MRDLVLFEKMADALRHLLRDTTAPLLRGAEVEGDVGVGVAAKQVDAAQHQVGALADNRAVDLVAHQLAAGIHEARSGFN